MAETLGSEAPVLRLRGVRVHNLRSIDLDLPWHALIAVTGPSGSGKSSLAFDTLYAEGQRQYIETFSTYARQFLDRIEKPDADSISGMPVAIAVGQRITRHYSRATVGSITELDNLLQLLYGRQGTVVCPECRRNVLPASVSSIDQATEALPSGMRYHIAFPMTLLPNTPLDALRAGLIADGFLRIQRGGEILLLEHTELSPVDGGEILVVVDRLTRGRGDRARRRDAIETALTRGLGRCVVSTEAGETRYSTSWQCEGCGRCFEKPEPRLFRPENPAGACRRCEGLGWVHELDLDRVVPDQRKSIRDGAVLPWTMPAHRGWLEDFLRVADELGVRTTVPFRDLSGEEVARLLHGGAGHAGLTGFMRHLEKRALHRDARVFLARWRKEQPCPACLGARLRPEACAVRFEGRSLPELWEAPIREVLRFFDATLAGADSGFPARRLLERIKNKLQTLDRIGLDYLTLGRAARTLSTGELRRVGLSRAIGTGLVNMLYILDEPTIGLHAVDTERVIRALGELRNAGNTVVVVEHDLGVIRAADWVVDLGPGAGVEGGRVLYAGPPEGLRGGEESLTGEALFGQLDRPRATRRRSVGTQRLTLKGATGHHLKNLNVEFPLGVFCVVTGPSGAGKSTLIEQTLYPALARRLENKVIPGEPFKELSGTRGLGDVVLLDTAAISRTPRSNPATYLKVLDEIRKTFAATHEARLRNYGPGRFSFNVEGGRCTSCDGNGYIVIDMQFLPDIMTPCGECGGRRFRPEVLEVKYRGKSIAEVLDMTAREAFVFFRHRPKIQSRLRALLEVGLDYMRLGQPANTLSGGEAQRLKLALHFSAVLGGGGGPAGEQKPTIFLLDEPTTGLHIADVNRLLGCLHALVDRGHSLIVIEQSLQVVWSADWVIELGPGAGDRGGALVSEGTPEAISQEKTATGRALRAWLDTARRVEDDG